VTPYIPSPVRVRPYAFIRELAARGHQITLICLAQPAWEEQYLPEVASYCQKIHLVHLDRWEPYLNCLASLPTAMPLSVAYCRSRRGRELVEALVRSGRYDLVHTEFMRAAPLTADLNSRPKVFDAVDSLTLTYRRSLSAAYVSPPRRLIALAEWLKVRRFEPKIMHCFDRVVISSPADGRVLEDAGCGQTSVIANGVDTSYFSFSEGPRHEETIVFLGKMSYYPNVASVLWFYHQVFPLIRRQRPAAKLKIVGRNPVPKIMALTADKAVQVTGSVPDVRPYLSEAAVSICPMVTGAGIQNKMLEAMAAGAAAVATSLACQALQVESGRDVLIGDSAEEFASHVLNLLDHKDLRDQLARNARRYVEEYHVWARTAQQLETIYNNLVN
jgi:sugar transferase (PEP-CTERM/EpsH1 system associated)